MKVFVLEKINAFKKNGYTEKDVANFFGCSIMELRQLISRRNRENRIVLASMAKSMRDAGNTVSEIAKELEKNESSVRLLLEFPTAMDIDNYTVEVAKQIAMDIDNYVANQIKDMEKRTDVTYVNAKIPVYRNK